MLVLNWNAIVILYVHLLIGFNLTAAASITFQFVCFIKHNMSKTCFHFPISLTYEQLLGFSICFFSELFDHFHIWLEPFLCFHIERIIYTVLPALNKPCQSFLRICEAFILCFAVYNRFPAVGRKFSDWEFGSNVVKFFECRMDWRWFFWYYLLFIFVPFDCSKLHFVGLVIFVCSFYCNFLFKQIWIFDIVNFVFCCSFLVFDDSLCSFDLCNTCVFPDVFM